MLVKHLDRLKGLVAWVALECHLRHCALVGRDHLSLLLVKNVLCNRGELSDSTLSVVNMEVGAQMQLVVYNRVKLDVTS